MVLRSEGEFGASIGHSWPPDPGGAGGNNHYAATTKTDEEPDTEGITAVAENKESAAIPTTLNSPVSNDFARALAANAALRIATANPWPPDPGRARAFKRPPRPPDPGGPEAACTGA